MNISKKIISIVTIILSSIIALDLIIWLFSQNLFISGNLLIIMATLAIGGFFAINSFNMFHKNKIIALTSLVLICVSVLLIIFATLIKLNLTYLNITISFGLLSVLFNIIVSRGLDLGKKYLTVQIIVYILVFIVDLYITLAIFGAVNLGDTIALFVTAIILAILGVVILKVLAKRQVAIKIDNDENLIKLTKEEYNILLDKAKKYDEIMNSSNVDNK